MYSYQVNKAENSSRKCSQDQNKNVFADVQPNRSPKKKQKAFLVSVTNHNNISASLEVVIIKVQLKPK